MLKHPLASQVRKHVSRIADTDDGEKDSAKRDERGLGVAQPAISENKTSGGKREPVRLGIGLQQGVLHL